jgi:hypothetical protein
MTFKDSNHRFLLTVCVSRFLDFYIEINFKVGHNLITICIFTLKNQAFTLQI